MKQKFQNHARLLLMLLITCIGSTVALAQTHTVKVKSSQTSELFLSTTQDAASGSAELSASAGTTVYVTLANKSGVNEIGSLTIVPFTTTAGVRTRATESLDFYQPIAASAITAVEAGFQYSFAVPTYEGISDYGLEVSYTAAVKKTVSSITLSAESYTYNGTEQKPTVTKVTMSDNTEVTEIATIESSFDITYASTTGYTPDDLTNWGSKTVTATSKGASHYQGAASATYTIHQQPLSQVSGYAENWITLSASNATYDAATHEVTVSVKYDGTNALAADAYQVTWLKKSGNTFETMAPQPTKAADSHTYTLPADIAEYQAQVSQVNEVGTVHKSNYTFTVNRSFTVDKRELSSTMAKLTLAGQDYTGDIAPVYSRGVNQRPTLTMTDNYNSQDHAMTLGTDYTVSWEYTAPGSETPTNVTAEENKFVNRGTYRLTVSGAGNTYKETSTFTRTVNIGQRALTTDDIKFYVAGSSDPVETTPFTGENITVTVKVFDGENELVQGTDYTLAWDNATIYNRGSYRATVTGTGDYTGTPTKLFSVANVSLANATVMNPTNAPVYNGQNQKPTGYQLTYGTQVLEELTSENAATADYQIVWKNAANQEVNVESGFVAAGQYKGYVTGLNDFANEAVHRELEYTIAPKPITLDMITKNDDAKYDGTEHAHGLAVTDGETQLTAGTDYTVTWKFTPFEGEAQDNFTGTPNAAGTYTATITGKGNYTETRSAVYTIEQRALTLNTEGITATIKVDDTDYDSNKDQNIYTGSELKPTITVKDGETTLVAGTNYTITWTYKKVDGTPDESFNASADNAFTNAGTYTATIAGKVNYDEQFTRDYVIKQKDVTLDMITLTDGTNNTDIDTKLIATNETASFTPTLSVTHNANTVTEQFNVTWQKFNVNNMAWENIDITSTTPLTESNIGYYQAKVSPTNGNNNYSSFAFKTLNFLQDIAEGNVIKTDGVKFYKDNESEALTDALIVYDGKTHTLALKVFTQSGQNEVNAESYNYKWVNSNGNEVTTFKDADTYTVTIAAYETSSYRGVRSRTFKIDPATLDRSWFVLMNGEEPQTDVYYDNTEHKPDVKVTTDTNVNVPTGLSVENDVDVTWDTEDFTNHGTKTVTITPKSDNKNYTGEVDRSFAIERAVIQKAWLAFSTDEVRVTYNKQGHTPQVKVTDKRDGMNNAELTAVSGETASGYTLAWTDGNSAAATQPFVNADTYTATVTGQGNYTGTHTIVYNIDPYDLTKTTITLVDPSDNTTDYSTKEYKGSAWEKPVVVVTAPTDSQLGTLVQKTSEESQEWDYTISWADGDYTKQGSYFVTVTGNSNYTGTPVKAFNITAKPILSDWIKVSAKKVKTSDSSEDHSVLATTEQNNVRTYSAEYKFVPEVTVSYTIGSGENAQIVTLQEQSGDTGDYTVTWYKTADIASGRDGATAINIATDGLTTVGSYTVYVDAKELGNYSGSQTSSFEIKKRPLSDEWCVFTVKVGDDEAETTSQTKPYKSGSYTVVTDVKTQLGSQLTKDTDYSLNWTYTPATNVSASASDNYDTSAEGAFTNAGTYQVTITGKGNYDENSSMTRTLTIEPKKFSESTISVTINGDNSKNYNNLEFDTPIVVVKDTERTGTQELTIDSEYTLTWYKEGTNGMTPMTTEDKFLAVGTYTAIASGKGNYDSATEKSVAFTIVAGAIENSWVVFTTPSGHIYDGQKFTPSSESGDHNAVFTVTDPNSNYVLVKGTDYEETITENGDFTSAGSHTVTITGKGSYGGTATSASPFVIAKKDINTMALAGSLPTVGETLPGENTIAAATTGSEGFGSATVTWTGTLDGENKVKSGETYTGTITVTADGNHQFVTSTESPFSATLNDVATEATINAEGKLIVTYTDAHIAIPFVANQEWGTFCSEHSMILPDGLTAYYVYNIDDQHVYVKPIEGQTVPAIPLIVKRSSATTAETIDCHNGPANTTDPSDRNVHFKGVTTATQISHGSMILREGVFTYAASGTLAANRCYIEPITSSTSGVRQRTIVVDGDGTTAISSISFGDATTMDGEWYTLGGQRIERPTKKGMYILNNQKVVIK